MSNLLQFRFYPGRGVQPGDLAAFTVYDKSTSELSIRKTMAWMAIVTKVKAHNIEVFDPTQNKRYDVRAIHIIQFMPGCDDMQKTSPNMMKLLGMAKLGTDQVNPRTFNRISNAAAGK